MSYCRWSTDNFGCDLYCYQGPEGYVIHVATSRILGSVPRVNLEMLMVAPEAYAIAQQQQLRFLDSAQRARIGLPFDGATFIESSLDGFLAKLRLLKSVGYRFPESVIEAVRGEIEQARQHAQERESECSS